MRTALLAAVAALHCAGCAAPRDSAAFPPALQRYADVASFLLPGFVSVALHTLPIEPDEDTPDARTTTVLVARCGSDFEAPRRADYGPFRGVTVWDWGPGGWTNEARPGERVEIAGWPAWHVRGEGPHDPDLWVAHVDQRYNVASDHRGLLERALLRRGTLAEVLSGFPQPSLDPDADSFVFLLPRPADRTYWGRPVPIEPMVITLTPQLRLRIHHRAPLPAEFVSWQQFAKGAPTTADHGEGTVTTLELQVDSTMRLLLLELLFGLAIFI